MSRSKRRAARRRRRERQRAERECRLVWAASLPPPPSDLSAGREPCRHAWGESETVSVSCGSRDEMKVCTKCQGIAHRCEGCRAYHLVYEGQGGEYSMPPMGPRVVVEGARVRWRELRRHPHTVRENAPRLRTSDV